MTTATTEPWLATSRYRAQDLVKASGRTPVGITLGQPRFPLSYQLADNLRLLAPTYAIFNLDWPDYVPAYLARLEKLGAEKIRRVLVAINHKHGEQGLVLLCFEDVWAGEHCHRRLFADWWHGETGDEVPELSELQGRLV